MCNNISNIEYLYIFLEYKNIPEKVFKKWGKKAWQKQMFVRMNEIGRQIIIQIKSTHTIHKEFAQ